MTKPASGPRFLANTQESDEVVTDSEKAEEEEEGEQG